MKIQSIQDLKTEVEKASKSDRESKLISGTNGTLKVHVDFFRAKGAFIHERHSIYVWKGERLIIEEKNKDTEQVVSILNGILS